MALYLPNLNELNQDDLSVQVLGSLFGDVWHNLASQAANGTNAVLGDLLICLAKFVQQSQQYTHSPHQNPMVQDLI